MVANVTALLMLVVYIVAGAALYRCLAARVSRNALSAINAAVLLWAVLAVAPWVLTWVGFRAGWHVYDAYPTLRHQSWDVGLALVTYLSMMLCYGLGFVGACIATWRFVILERHSSANVGAT